MSETQRLGSEDCDGRGVAGKEKREEESVSVLVTGVKRSRRGKNERRAKRGTREQQLRGRKGSSKSRCKKRSKGTDFISIGTICDQASLSVS
jgi:hypothetical protein